MLNLARTVAKKVDLLIVGGDLNSSPDSKVYSKFLGEGLTDPQIERENSRKPSFHTWGHEKNTWTSEEDGYRVDYLFYKPLGNRLSNVRTSMFGILDAKTEGMSLSDHMGVEANLEITFSNRQEIQHWTPLYLNTSSRIYYLIHHLAPPCNVGPAFFSPLRPLPGLAGSCLWGGCLCHHLPAPTRMDHLLSHP